MQGWTFTILVTHFYVSYLIILNLFFRSPHFIWQTIYIGIYKYVSIDATGGEGRDVIRPPRPPPPSALLPLHEKSRFSEPKTKNIVY